MVLSGSSYLSGSSEMVALAGGGGTSGVWPTRL